MHFRKQNRFRAAYTLVEALVASSILMVGVGAAASLAMTMVTQEEINHEVSRALAYQENAIRLYHIGLAPATIANVLPEEPSVSQLSFVANTNETLSGGTGSLRHKTISVTMTSGGQSRTNTVEVYRSTMSGDDVDSDAVFNFTSGALSGGYTAP